MARNNDYEHRVKDRRDRKPDKSSQPLHSESHKLPLPYHLVFYDYIRSPYINSPRNNETILLFSRTIVAITFDIFFKFI